MQFVQIAVTIKVRRFLRKMKNPRDPRHKRRQKIVEELFSLDFHKQKATKESSKIFSAKKRLDKYIESAAPEFPVGKINRIDLAILRLAVYELFVEKKEPPRVIIDEAIELAKEYGGETSPQFINGALGKLQQGLKNEKTS